MTLYRKEQERKVMFTDLLQFFGYKNITTDSRYFMVYSTVHDVNITVTLNGRYYVTEGLRSVMDPVSLPNLKELEEFLNESTK